MAFRNALLALFLFGTAAHAPDESRSDPVENRPDVRVGPTGVASTTQGISTLSNRTSFTLSYSFRWKTVKGWTPWKNYSVASRSAWIHHCRGGNQAQIRFDRYFNDGKVTEHLINLPITVAPWDRKPKDVSTKKHSFYAEGKVLKLYKVDPAAERRALQFTGVVTIANPRRHTRNAQKIPYQVRWRGYDGHWGSWKNYNVTKGRVMDHWLKGATRCEVRFDRVGGDGGKVTLKTYNLNFDTIPAWKKPGAGDGRKYEFKYRNRYDLDIFRSN